MDKDEFRRRQEARVIAHWKAPKPAAAVDLAHLQAEASARAPANRDEDEATQPLNAALADALEYAFNDWAGRGTGAPYLGGRAGEAYAEYFRSPHWRATRQRMLERSSGFCQRCNRRFRLTALDVHHRNYRCLGAERERDLEVLCRECHTAEHGRPF